MRSRAPAGLAAWAPPVPGSSICHTAARPTRLGGPLAKALPLGVDVIALQFWFEFASTYSYPAAVRIGPLAASQGVPIVWKPFLLGPIFRDQGWSDSPFNLYPAKGRYMWRDLERICTAEGIPFRRPTQFPRNGLLAARIACGFGAEPWLPGFVRRVFRANFAEDRDISDPAILAACLEPSAPAFVDVLERAQSAPAKDRLRAQTQEAAGRGIFGAPSFVVGSELFWGNDRLEAALAFHRQHPGSP